MLDRAKVVDENFLRTVREGDFWTSPHEAIYRQLDKVRFIDLFESQMMSRHIDLQARILKEKGLGHYTIGSSGHEGNAAIASHFRQTDPAFLHYRSSAFMIQRAKQCPTLNPVYDQLLSLVASAKDPISAGRHKVFGSVPLSVPPQTSTIASHLPKAVGAAFSIARARSLGIKTKMPQNAVVLCSFGDASLNHSTAQGALNTAQWIDYQQLPLPIVFICEDNQVGISVPTPRAWVKESVQDRLGIYYLEANGLDLDDIYQAAGKAAEYAREKRRPVFLHMRCIRLMGHAGSDIESQYWTAATIEQNEKKDPLLQSARIAIQQQYLTAKDIIAKYETIREEIAMLAGRASKTKKLSSAQEVMSSIIPPKRKITLPPLPSMTKRKSIWENNLPVQNKRNLAQLINLTLTDLMLQFPEMVVFGEDVGKKGGVYRVTADLQKHFGVARVFDTLLDEQTILGTAIGFAHNGFLPVPEIQFLAYLHNAEDQLRGEAATLSFFSNGQYTNPMVIRIAGLAYQKGFGGHFHNDNSLAVLRDIPGIIIACPSNGRDAAKLLRTCVALAYLEQRVVVFVEPIALYMTKDLYQPGDQGWLFDYPAPEEKISLGEVSVHGDPKATITILTYGNGFYLSRQAQTLLALEYGISIKVVDLHWIAPMPVDGILRAIRNATQVLIVDECRKTGSYSEALITMIFEKCEKQPTLKRVTGEDSFIPLGDAWQTVLPSQQAIVNQILNWVGKPKRRAVRTVSMTRREKQTVRQR